MPGRLKSRHFAFAAVILACLFFQNCDSTSMDTQNSSQSSMPFAYTPVVDTIAYMSCSDIASTGFEPRAYFSFRAGAYNSATGGLAISNDFYTETKNYDPTDRGGLLSSSDANSGIYMNLSIRSAGNYQSLWATTSATQGNEFDVFLPQLDSAQIEGPLASSANGQMVNYFPGDQDKRLMEASLRFLQYENVAQDTRNNLDNRNAYLIAGFTSTADPADQNLRSPVDFNFTCPSQLGENYNPYTHTCQTGPIPTVAPNPLPNQQNEVFGIAYVPNDQMFALPQGYTGGDRRVLSSSGLQEMDLTTGQIRASNWDCSQSYEFMIVRPEDKAAGTVICNATVDRYSNTTQQAELNAIRRVLRVEDWWVDLDNRCVMPKGTGDYCYGQAVDQAQAGMVTIQYGLSSCVDNLAKAPFTVCPHFVSVCIRH